MLAKRLIRGLATLEENERYLIYRLREVYDHTGRLKQMLLDMEVAKDLQESFNNWSADGQQARVPGFPTLFRLLSSAHWPLHLPAAGFQAPHILLETNANFERFYHEEHPGRRISWLWQLSHGELRMATGDGYDSSHILCVSAYQMAILMLFNQEQALPFEAIETKTGIPSETLVVLLNRFVRAKILRVADSEQAKTRIYSVNQSFKPSKRRVDLRGTLKTQKAAELQEARQKIKEDQSLLLQVSCPRRFQCAVGRGPCANSTGRNRPHHEIQEEDDVSGTSDGGGWAVKAQVFTRYRRYQEMCGFVD